MGRRPKGMSQDECRALWKRFMDAQFTRTSRQVRFNDRTRTVYEGTFTWRPPGKKEPLTIGPVYLVLDEWHGDVEVCEHRIKRGKAAHIGSLQLDINDGGAVSVAAYHCPPKTAHTFVLI